MKISSRTRLQLSLQHTLFVILLLVVAGLLAWLSVLYPIEADWTRDQRHSLSEASRELLEKMPDPVHVTAYVSRENTLRRTISRLVDKYQRHKVDFHLRFVAPAEAPAEVRAREITQEGELLVEYQGRVEHLLEHSEQAMTQTLQRLLRGARRWLVFLQGHGERDPLGKANHDYGFFGRHLKSRGFNVQGLSLTEAGGIPDNTAVLVIAGPQVKLLPGEVEVLRRYLASGGNLLWLLDPGDWQGLKPLAEQLGLERQPGVLMDPASNRLLGLLGAQQQSMVLVNDYGPHPITRDLPTDMLTLFPEAAGLKLAPPDRWEKTVLLRVKQDAWSELDQAADQAEFNPERDIAGPFELGVALSRSHEQLTTGGETRHREQRVVIIGDGDFLANAYVENSGNLDLGLRVFNWLSHDDSLISLAPEPPSDQKLTLSTTALAFIAFNFLLVLPAALLITGLTVWYRRRRA